jgi:hypothetical protein
MAIALPWSATHAVSSSSATTVTRARSSTVEAAASLKQRYQRPVQRVILKLERPAMGTALHADLLTFDSRIAICAAPSMPLTAAYHRPLQTAYLASIPSASGLLPCDGSSKTTTHSASLN